MPRPPRGASRPTIDPWEVLRRLRARTLVDATVRDDDIGGADAVIELCEIREMLDDALRHAPRKPAA